MKRILHPLAVIELTEVSEWYEKIDPELRESFIREFKNKAEPLFSQPLSFRLRDHGCRRANLNRFPTIFPIPLKTKKL